ncbi:MAG: alternative ribosome rescue aminoacyl-tRNA hydrolase ArfB [Bacteroidales bacterium]|jgi:ribosome-associated protein
MKKEQLTGRKLETEFVFKGTRSSGPGGQNVNKVNSRIELRFNITLSEKLSAREKRLILSKLARRINSAGELIIVSQSERSQLGNKKKAAKKFYSLLSKALTVKPARIPTSPTPGSRVKRLEIKRKRSSIKKLRGGGDSYDE